MMKTTTKAESPLHKALVKELLLWLRNAKGYTIKAADLEGYNQPKLVANNSNVGDGEAKRPDLDAFDGVEKVYIRGEAKTGNEDLGTPHTKTQFRLFANRTNHKNGKASLLFIIVPANKLPDLKAVLRDLGLLNKPNVITVKSG